MLDAGISNVGTNSFVHRPTGRNLIGIACCIGNNCTNKFVPTVSISKAGMNGRD